MEAREIMHPSDAKTIQVFRSLKGFDLVASIALRYGYERLYRGENLGELIKVTDENFPEVARTLHEVVARVGIEEPRLFIYNSPQMNAYTFGNEAPFVAVSSSMVEKMDRQELRCILAHECGHVLCQHSLYLTILHIMEEAGDLFGLLSDTVFLPCLIALRYWSRCSELSADRCAAAVVGEETFQRALLKLTSGLEKIQGDPYQLVRQAAEYEKFQGESVWDKVQQAGRIAFNTHPQMCERALETHCWCKSWQYRQLIAGPKKETAL
ncbi:MAG: M48 family metallopeptidase [Bacteroidales bacterium]|nr:M48 family metallopeptidase [Bacteroidales bacterium]